MRHGTYILPSAFESKPVAYQINVRANNLIPGWIRAKILERKLKALWNYTLLGVRSHKPMSSHNMVNDAVPVKIMNGDIIVRSGIHRFERSKVIFVDGLEVSDVDCVIFATGYDVKFPFFKNENFIGGK